MESAERGKESDIGVEKRTASRASKGAKRYRFGPFAAGILFFFFLLWKEDKRPGLRAYKKNEEKKVEKRCKEIQGRLYSKH